MSSHHPKVAVITGSASGIGLALATTLVANGWAVVLLDLNQDEGVRQARKLGPHALFYQCDVSSYQSQAKAFRLAWNEHGRVDAFVANAGIQDKASVYTLRHKNGGIDDVPPAPNLICTDINLKGVIYGVQLAIHFMRHNSTPGGKIVLMGSIAGVAPDPTFPEYSSTKAAVINFARAVARPLRIKENISVNVVCPNAVPTKLDPPEFHAAVGTDALTSTETVVSAFLEFLEEQGDSRRYACALECSQDRLIVLKEPEVGNGEISLRSVTPWDGYFKMIHGEPSELDGALPESTV